MERLTKREPQGFAFYTRCFEKCEGMPDDCAICEEQEKQCETLAAYEDTGLTPDEIMELKKAADAQFGMESPAPDASQCEQIAPVWEKYLKCIGADVQITTADVMAMLLLAAATADGAEDELRETLRQRLTEEAGNCGQ